MSAIKDYMIQENITISDAKFKKHMGEDYCEAVDKFVDAFGKVVDNNIKIYE